MLLRLVAEKQGVAGKVLASTAHDIDRIAADGELLDVPAPCMAGGARCSARPRLALKHGRLALAIDKGKVVRVDRE